jgi:hypothetical protein
MSKDHRTPGQDVVDVGVSIHINEPRPFGASDETGLPSDRSEGTDGTIHTTGNELLRLFKELGRSRDFHNGGAT